MEMLQEYAIPMITATCFAIGFCIKKFTPESFDNKYIPSIMAILGVILNSWSNDFSFTPAILLGGLASGLAATGVHQVAKSLNKKEA